MLGNLSLVLRLYGAAAWINGDEPRWKEPFCLKMLIELEIYAPWDRSLGDRLGFHCVGGLEKIGEIAEMVILVLLLL